MRLTLDPPRAVRDITQTLEAAGHSTWAVGGAVRDAVLRADAHLQRHGGGDWDLATHARPEQVRALFRRTVPIGIEHGTVGVLAADGVLYEVTTFRRDIETFGRHAVVEFSETIDEDLSRRDFTINALAWHALTEELRDPFQGLADLRARLLRTVGEPADRFAEDYLRVLRALRFAGHFALQIEAGTWTALCAATPQLTQLSAERVREELWKIFGKTKQASVALELYAASGSLDVVYPELVPLRGLQRDPGGLDAWQVSLAAVDALPTSRSLLRMAALLHGIGLPAARSKDLRGGVRFTGHEQLGARKAEEVMRRLKAANVETERVTELVAKQSMLAPPDAPDAGLRRWLLHVRPALVRDLFRLRFALWRAQPTRNGDRELIDRWRRVHSVLLAHPVIDTRDLAINGQDLVALGFKPGPQFGEILRALLERVLEQPALNTREQLLGIVQEEPRA